MEQQIRNSELFVSTLILIKIMGIINIDIDFIYR